MMTVVCLSVSLSGAHTLNYSHVAVKFSLQGQRSKVKVKGFGHGWTWVREFLSSFTETASQPTLKTIRTVRAHILDSE